MGSSFQEQADRDGGSRDEFIHHVISLNRRSDCEYEYGRSLPRWFGSVSTQPGGALESSSFCARAPSSPSHYGHSIWDSILSTPTTGNVQGGERRAPWRDVPLGLLIVSARLCPLSACHRRMSPWSRAHAGQRSRSPTHVMNHPQT